ncbi:MAG: hypothetical protein FJ297_00545 [Planctomycetes bacterium]|nr:hypothetical protein [Planctomycetota bacterium]
MAHSAGRFPKTGLVARAVCLLFAAVWGPAARGQPQHAPPEHVTPEAAAEQLGGVTRITVHAREQSPTTVLREIARQAGVGLDDYDVRETLGKSPPLTIDVEDQPFWQVMRSVTTRLGIHAAFRERPDFWSHESGWMLELRSGADTRVQGPSRVEGPFVIVASRSVRSRYLTEPSEPPRGTQAMIDLIILVDPRVRLRGRPSGRDLKVLDDRGNPLTVVGPEYSWPHDVQMLSPLMWRLTAVVDLPEQGATRIGKIQGVLSDLVATVESERWEVSDLSVVPGADASDKGSARRAGGAQFAIRSLIPEPDGDERQFRLTLASFGLGETADFGWPARTGDDRAAAIELLDGAGRRYFAQSWEEAERGVWHVRFRPRVDKENEPVGDPAKLIWKLPTKVVEIDVPFEFTDLPLP